MWLSNVRKLYQPRMSDTYMHAALSELIVSTVNTTLLPVV